MNKTSDEILAEYLGDCHPHLQCYRVKHYTGKHFQVLVDDAVTYHEGEKKYLVVFQSEATKQIYVERYDWFFEYIHDIEWSYKGSRFQRVNNEPVIYE